MDNGGSHGTSMSAGSFTLVLNLLSKATLAGALLVAFGFGQNLAWAEDQSAGSSQREIEDGLGRRVVMTAPPRRIVAVFPSTAKMIVALGLEDNIVGIDAYVRFPLEILDRPKIGGRLGLSLEQIVATNPDLVVMTPARQAVHTLVGPLEKMGIPVVVLNNRTMAEVMSNLEKLAIITGRTEQSKIILKDMKERLAQVCQRRLGHPKPKVVFISNYLPSGLFMTVRKGGYMADMVELAGGVMALESNQKILPSSPQISPEALMSVDPDIILYSRRTTRGYKLEAYLRRPAFSTLKAYRNGHMYPITGREFGIPSPKVVDGVEMLADIFEGWGEEQ